MVFKVKVITQGKAKEPWLQESLLLYEKRLKGRMEIEWILFENEKNLVERILNEPTIIALDVQGQALTSTQFSRSLFTEWGSRPSFAIGGASGLSQEILRNAKYRISLSTLTFTHQMVRLILIEQLYRAIEIEKASAYHK